MVSPTPVNVTVPTAAHAAAVVTAPLAVQSGHTQHSVALSGENFPSTAFTANAAVTVTAGPPATLRDTRRAWTVNQWAGALCRMSNGATFIVASNTVNTLTGIDVSAAPADDRKASGWGRIAPANGLAYTLSLATVDILVEWSFDGGTTWRHRASATGCKWDGVNHLGITVELFDRDQNKQPLPSFGGAALPTHTRTTLTPHGGSVTFGGTVTVS